MGLIKKILNPIRSNADNADTNEIKAANTETNKSLIYTESQYLHSTISKAQ
jgi:hypothetical protein